MGLRNIKKAIYESGLTECEDTNWDGCVFNKKSSEAKELGNVNICVLLNDIYRVKEDDKQCKK